MEKADILNLLWMPLVTHSYRQLQGDSCVTWKTGCSAEHTVHVYFKEYVPALSLDKRKICLSAFTGDILLPPPYTSSVRGMESREHHILFQILSQGQDKRKGSESATKRGESWETQAEKGKVVFVTLEWDCWRTLDPSMQTVNINPP